MLELAKYRMFYYKQDAIRNNQNTFCRRFQNTKNSKASANICDKKSKILSEMRSIELYLGFLDFSIYSLKLRISYTSESVREKVFLFFSLGVRFIKIVLYANGFSVLYGKLAGWLYPISHGHTPMSLNTSNSAFP